MWIPVIPVFSESAVRSRNGPPPKRDPENRKDWNWQSKWPRGKTAQAWDLQEIDFTNSSADVHRRQEVWGKVNYDWKFSFSVSGTPPEKLYAGDTFTMSIKGNAGGEKRTITLALEWGLPSSRNIFFNRLPCARLCGLENHDYSSDGGVIAELRLRDSG